MATAIPERYRPAPIRSYLGPKRRGGGRRFAILTRRDERIWSTLAGRVASILEPRLDRSVAANRTVLARDGWRVEPTETALRRARSRAPKQGLILRTDVQEFYASITPPVLVRVLGNLGVPSQESRLAGRMVEEWTESSYRGLPIGPVGSAVLANAVLTSVDEALSSFRFIRWVDDYVISVPSERAAAAILDRLDASLARLHLRRSAPKTEVREGTGAIPWLRGNPPAFASPAHM